MTEQELKDGEVDVEREILSEEIEKFISTRTGLLRQETSYQDLADWILAREAEREGALLEQLRILQESHDFLSQSQDIQRALCDKLEEQYLADQKEISALKEKLGRAVGYIEGRAGLDCYQYDKHLSPKLCGKCDSCEASKLLKEIESSGGAGK